MDHTVLPMRDTSNNLKLGLRLTDILLTISVVILPACWLFERLLVKLGPAKLTISWGHKPIVMLLTLIAIRIALSVWMKKRGASARGLVGHPAVGPLLVGITLLFIIFYSWEKKLERAGFEHATPALVIAGEDDKLELRSPWEYADPELLWAWRPGAEFNGRMVNSIGFLDREVDPEKTAGTQRVICMGCSCTGQGIPPYSGFLNDYLNEAEPGKWDAFNMGVHGYSTSQGLRLFQNRGAELAPDFVTIFYGWNDHWRARTEDSKRMAWRATSKWKGALITALKKKRFFQYMVKQSTPDYVNVLEDDEFVLRVPPPEYRKNLLQFIAEIRQANATPILIAAPRGSQLTPSLVKNRQAASLDSARALHDDYLNILYDVAKETDVAVIDLPQIFANDIEKEIFSDDGIHFQREGRKRIARAIHKKLNDLVDQP